MNNLNLTIITLIIIFLSIINLKNEKIENFGNPIKAITGIGKALAKFLQ